VQLPNELHEAPFICREAMASPAPKPVVKHACESAETAETASGKLGPMVCPSCGATNDLDARYCKACGRALAVPVQERRRLATSVFCDLSGSTALAERVDAEVLLELMASYYDGARAALERHGGLVEKFIGDAVVGLFGVPETHEDDAL